jgi:hypothetical protein
MADSEFNGRTRQDHLRTCPIPVHEIDDTAVSLSMCGHDSRPVVVTSLLTYMKEDMMPTILFTPEMRSVTN